MDAKANRLSPPSRWPLDVHARIQRANIDIDFIDALRGCGCVDYDGSMNLLEYAAMQIKTAAKAELERGK